MARPKDPDLERTWRRRLQRQTFIGLSISAFCAREGVSSASFHAWKRRLTARALAARPQPPLFVLLHLDSSSRQADPPPGGGVGIELPHRVRLRFDAPSEPDWLVRVVAALAGLPGREANS